MQKNRKTNKPKYSKLPTKEVNTTPWTEVCIDLIGPYTVKTRNVDSEGIYIKLTLVSMTCIDLVTGCFKIVKVLYVDHSSAFIVCP